MGMTEADENRMCLTIATGDWFPSRVDYGNPDTVCGIPATKTIKQFPQLVWSFTGLGDNTRENEEARVSNQYLIRYKGKQGSCLFFGDHGKDLYPSLQHCKDYENEAECPWINARAGQPLCGFEVDGTDRRTALLENRQAIWKVTTLQLNERKFLLQSAASGATNPNGVPSYDCLVFEQQGAATHPTRYNWGNGDDFCGAGDWEGKGKDIALMAN